MGSPERQGEALADLVRRHDPDRFLVSLFLPAPVRPAAWTLVAFNHELARAVETGSRRDGEAGRFASLVRLQWWREVVEGAVRRHEVATPLSALLSAGAFDGAALETMIAARERELDGFSDLDAWRAGLGGGPGTLAVLLAGLAGADAATCERCRAAGAAYGAGASLRNRAALAAVGRAPFPQDGHDPAVLARAAQAWLPPPGPRAAFTASLLHAVLARRDLARLAAGREEPGPRRLGDRLAVLAAFLRRSV